MSAEERAAIYNSRPGDLKSYDCQICNNKGHVMEIIDNYEYMRECQCMEVRRSAKRLENSGLADVVEMYRLDNFETSENYQEIMKRMAEDFLNKESGWFFVGGQVGSGKTHICTAICSELMKKGKSVRYIIWPETVTTLKAIKMQEVEYADAMNDMKRYDVLYLDDFFKKQVGMHPTSADVDIAFELLNSLYLQKGKRVIISSERTVQEITDSIDQGLGSRIFQKCGEHQMFIKKDFGRNYRLKGEKHQ